MEEVLVVTASSGAAGLGPWTNMVSRDHQRDLGELVGCSPAEAFTWRDGIVFGVSEPFAALVSRLPALEAVLLDLCAQERGVPVRKLLGQTVRPEIPVVESSIYFEDLMDEHTSVADVVERCREAVAAGHRSLKLRVGRGFQWMPWPDCTERDLEVCNRVREAVGPDIRLCLDGDGGFAGYTEDAADLLSEAAALQIAFCEDMVPDEDLPKLRAELRRAGIEIPMAGGEHLERVAELDAYSLRAAPDILCVDMTCIGILQARGLAATAASRGQQICAHTFGSQLAFHQSLHLAAVTPNLHSVQYESLRLSSVSVPGVRLSCGSMTLGNAPGFGVTLIEIPQPVPT
jgi:L-alanine-DL-glutamate epimerase-like enolase superfamily enzyme